MNTYSTQRLAQDPGYPLVTRERTDKLDLLQHLTANLARTVVLCGPEGIGKTRLLQHFKESFKEEPVLCELKGDSQLGFEKIKEQISEAIAQKMPQIQAKPLTDALEKLPERDSFVLLLVDDAGDLAPGVMEQMISYAGQYPALRIVFALTHSDLYLKNATDSAVDDCYQIEIPALTELQCADFLEYLSTLPNPRIDFNAINETFVADLYRETHGIPGKILNKIPKSPNKNKLDYSAPILAVAVVGLILIALIVQWWSNRPKPVAQTTISASNKQQEVSKQQPETIKPQQPVPNPDVANTASNTGSATQQTTSVEQQKVAQADAMAQQVAINNPQQQPSVATPVQPSDSTGSTTPTVNTSTAMPSPGPQNLDEGGQWLIGQPVENVTLQLMAMPDPRAINDVMQKHQDLGESLRMLKTFTKRGKERYILLYGSFANAEQAGVEAKNLPKELRKTWTRRMDSIKAELMPVPLPSVLPPAPTINKVQ